MAVLVETKVTGSVTPELEKLLKRIEKLENKKIKIQFEEKGTTNKGITKEKEKQNKLILEELDMLKKIVSFQRQNYKESENVANGYLKIIQSGKMISQEDKKRLALTTEEEKAVRRVEKAKLDMHNSQKKANDLTAKAHSDTLKMNQKLNNEKTKQVEKAKQEEVRLEKQYERLKLAVIASGMEKQYRSRVKAIQKGGKIQKKEMIKVQDDLAKAMATKRGASANFTDTFSNFMVFRELGRNVTQGLAQISDFEDRLYQMGIVAGKTVLEIRGMRNEMYDLGSTIPRATNEIVSQITEIERTGRTYKEAVGIIHGASKLAVSSGKLLPEL